MNCYDKVDELTDVGSILTSPGFPNKYPSNEDCKAIVRVEKGHKIRLDILRFHLGFEINCTGDHLKIFDGDDENKRVLGNYCGYKSTIKPIISSGNTLLIQFHSDDTFEEIGFKLKITLGTLNSSKHLE